jgi:hypothetical protein
LDWFIDNVPFDRVSIQHTLCLTMLKSIPWDTIDPWINGWYKNRMMTMTKTRTRTRTRTRTEWDQFVEIFDKKWIQAKMIQDLQSFTLIQRLQKIFTVDVSCFMIPGVICDDDVIYKVYHLLD